MNKIIRKIKDGTLSEILREMRWIGSYGKKYVSAIVWYIFLGIVGTVTALASGIISKDIIDIVTGDQQGYLLKIAVVYVIMQLSGIILGAVTSRISAKVQLRVSQDIRAEVFKKIMLGDWERLSEYHSGDLIARSGRDAETVAGSIMGWIPSLMVNSLQFIGTFCVLFWFDRVLALMVLVSAPVTMLISGVLTKYIRKHSKKMREIGAEMTSFHAETFQNIQLIKSFNAVDIYCKKLGQLQTKQKNTTLDYNRFSIISSTVLSLVGMVVGGVCFFWSVYRLWGNEITFGEMTLFLQLSGGLTGAFSALVSLLPSGVAAATSAGRIMAVTQIEEEVANDSNEVKHISETGTKAVSIRVDSVGFSYSSGNRVFDSANLRADPGEIVALVGPSGGGKTTMLRLLLGMVKPKEGSIKVCGGEPEIEVMVSPSTRCMFAYVPQENTLFSGTVADNLRIACPEASDEKLEEVLEIACAYDFVSKMPDGINSVVGERGVGLSEGQIQRISIARALLTNAPILLFDEATSSLDMKTERELLRKVMAYRKGRTCIVTTHRPSVLEMCHRAYKIENSRVALMDKEEVSQMLKDF